MKRPKLFRICITKAANYLQEPQRSNLRYYFEYVKILFYRMQDNVMVWKSNY